METLDLASVYEAGDWDFRLDGTADLNRAAIAFDIEVRREGGQVSYAATLSGGDRGITAGDVAGRHVPGLDKVGLTEVTVTDERLVADFAFDGNKIVGEIAAFHAGSGKAPVLAMTLDRLAFGGLLPGAAGSALDGVDHRQPDAHGGAVRSPRADSRRRGAARAYREERAGCPCRRRHRRGLRLRGGLQPASPSCTSRNRMR